MASPCPCNGGPLYLGIHLLHCSVQRQLQTFPVQEMVMKVIVKNPHKSQEQCVVSRPYLSWESSFVHVSLKHLSSQSFVITADQVVSVVHTSTMNGKPTTKAMERIIHWFLYRFTLNRYTYEIYTLFSFLTKCPQFRLFFEFITKCEYNTAIRHNTNIDLDSNDAINVKLTWSFLCHCSVHQSV